MAISCRWRSRRVAPIKFAFISPSWALHCSEIPCTGRIKAWIRKQPPGMGATACMPGGCRVYPALMRLQGVNSKHAPLMALAPLGLAELNQAREVKRGLIQAATHQLEATAFGCFHNSRFLEGVSAGGFAGAREQLANPLEKSQ